VSLSKINELLSLEHNVQRGKFPLALELNWASWYSHPVIIVHIAYGQWSSLK
jgi:hypothetical protein